MDKQIIGVVGLGLIGGSMCKALIKSGHIVVGMDADKTTEDYAKLAGIIDDKLTDERVGKCDYIFIALYPQATVDYPAPRVPDKARRGCDGLVRRKARRVRALL